VHDHRTRDDPSVRPTGVDLAIYGAAALAIGVTIWSSFGATRTADAFGSDKLGHALAYAVDTFLLLLAVVWRPGRPQALVAWVVPILLGVAVLGGAIEIAQEVVGRDADALDWLADVSGIAIAGLVFRSLRARFGASNPPSDAF
jgi:hypothetical protein